MVKRLIAVLLLCMSAFATNYTVKAAGGGNFTTISACMTQMSTNGTGVADTCTVFAGTYNESPTVPAGSVGIYKTVTVNGSDIVSVLGFTNSSHTKLIGNCPDPATPTTAACGFFISNPSSPATACVSMANGTTDVYIRANTLYACGGIGQPYPTQVSFIYIQGNTESYTNTTVGGVTTTCPSGTGVGNSLNLYGNHFLVENNDFSHYTLSLNWNSQNAIVRNNTFHDQIEINNSGNCHSDTFFSDPGGTNLVNNMANVYEGNTQYNGVGPNAKGPLLQAPACSGCNIAIIRFNITNRIGSGSTTNDQNWQNVKVYNNTTADANSDAGTTGLETDNSQDSNPPTPAILNQIYYYSRSGIVDVSPGTCGNANSCNFGHNLAFCVAGCGTIYGHVYQSGLFTADPGNQVADPKFVNYIAPANPSNNYHLQSGSPAIAAGTFLTTANGAGSTSTSLVVADPTYFQDGYGLTNAFSAVSGDCIAITTVTKIVCVTAVNYVTKTLTLASAISWSNGDHVWLYSKSDGVVVLTGTAPDLGALPFGSSNPQAATPTCTPPGGTFTVPQSVSCSDTSPGAIMCATQDGTTPATNGATGCANGTKYTTTFTLSVTTTLKIIAGGTGYTDSAVQSYLFTIVANVPAMPVIWVDNLELSCLPIATCYNGANGKSPALTVPYTAPTYILTLAAGGGSWSPSAPCGLGVVNYTNDKTGMQNAINDTESCRFTNGVGFIIAYPPGAYSSTAGILIPQHNTVAATTPIILRSTMDSVLAGLPEPVCDGGVQDNIPTSLNIRISNPDCTGQNMYYELAPSNSSGVISGITTLSANTTILSAVTLSGSPQLVPLANGYVSPGNSYVVDSGGSQETVVGVSGVNQVGLYGVFTKNHAAGATVTYDVGNFTLANGKSTNTSAYNYLQYMGQLSCTAVACLPLEFCSANPGQSPACTGGVIGPDHWEFDDLAISECPGPVSGCVGAANSQFIIKTGFTGSAVSTNSFGSHIHFRRIWCHGDWTSLQVGTNAIADCFDIEGIQYFSIVGSKTSQGLWPGSEGHSGIIQAITGKIVNNVFDCCSSGMFAGGFSNAPFVGYVPFQDIQYGRNLFTFPYTWLGFQYPDPQGSGAIPNSNPYYGGANTPWIVAPTMVNVSGTTVTWASGDSFHDSTSTWPNNTITMAGVTCSTMPCKILSMGSGTWSGTCISAPPGTCPTTLTMKTAALAPVSGTTFTMSQPNIVRKNSDEKKEEERVAKYGNTYENVDNSGGQRGICTSNGIRNASGAEAANSNTLAQNYFATINDMYEVGSICRNTCAGRSFDARSAGFGSGNGSTFGMTRVSETDILDYNISFSNPGCPSGNGFDMQTTSGGESWSGNIACNAGAQTCSFGTTGTVFAMDPPSTQTGAITATAVASNVLTVTAANQFQAGQTISFSGLTNPSDTFLNSITVLVIPSGLSTSQFKANVVNANYSVSDTGTATADSIPVGQTSALTNTCLGVACGLAANLLQVNATNNFIVGEVLALGGFTGASSASLLNNQGVTVTAATSSSFQATGITGSYNTETEATGFANGPVGYQVLGMRTADPVFVQGCVTSGINMPTQVIGSHTVASGIAPGATAGNAPWTGSWTASNVQITWPWTTAQGNTGQSDTTGNCVIQNIQSNPQNFSITHATEITVFNARLRLWA